jgi:hypothetical protein
VVFWVVCVVLPPIYVLSNGLVGAVEGLGRGLVRGVSQAWKDLHKWWRMFEESK